MHGMQTAFTNKEGAVQLPDPEEPAVQYRRDCKVERRTGGDSQRGMKKGRIYPTRTRAKGFTSIELVIVIVVLSLLSASIIIKNPFTIKDYSSIAADQLIADIQYVQMRAMGMRVSQSIKLRVDAGDYGIYTVAEARKTLPGNVKVTGTSFAGTITFNSIGEPTEGVGTIDLSGGKTAGGQTIRVYASTGKTVIE